MNKILHIVLNDYVNDNRVRKAAELSSNLGWDTSIAFLSSNVSRVNSSDYVTLFPIEVSFRKNKSSRLLKILKYIQFIYNALGVVRQKKPSLIHCNDFNTLIIGWMSNTLWGISYIYDSHELFFSQKKFNGKLYEEITKLVERFFARNASSIVTVSDEIANLLMCRLNKFEVHVVRNVPEFWRKPKRLLLRERLGIKIESPVMLHQGMMIKERVDFILRAEKDIDPSIHMVFMGNGYRPNMIEARYPERVHFIDAVNYYEMNCYTADADLGVHTMEATSLNNMLALPNKLFEYIQGGLGLLVTNLPEMSKLVNELNLGQVFESGDIDGFSKKVNSILCNQNIIDSYKTAAESARMILCWEVESLKLKTIYQSCAK